MKLVKASSRVTYLLIALGLGGFLLSRVSDLPLIPAALTHDEIVYAVQAKSFAVSGKTTNQLFRPWSLQPIHPMYAELPATLLLPFFALIKDPLVATRLFTTILGLLFPLVLGWFTYEVFKDKKVAIFVSFITMFNPLWWQLSRLTYDAVFSTFFYLLGGALWLHGKRRTTLLGFLSLTLGFFQYQGYKLLFLPWVGLLFFLHNYPDTVSFKQLKQKGPFISLLLVFAVYLCIILPHQQVENRFAKTIFADTDYLSQKVNDARRAALFHPLGRMMDNKVTTILSYGLTRFFGAFNPTMLFLTGEPDRSAFAAWGRGWFYPVDSLLILIGMFLALHRQRSRLKAAALLFMVVFATIPSTLNAGGSWYLLRMLFAYTLLLIFAGWGMSYIFQKPGKWVMGGIYLLFIIDFAYYYFVRYPILGHNISYLAERVASVYIDRSHRLQPDVPVYFYTIDPPLMFWNYLVYTDNLNPNNLTAIAAAEKSGHYQIDNVIFSDSCADLARTDTVIISESGRVPCVQTQSQLATLSETEYAQRLKANREQAITIPSIVDNGGYFSVYNNRLCDYEALKGFVTLKNKTDFAISRQNDQDFCSTWFVNYPVNEL